jgi:hypothetical protein
MLRVLTTKMRVQLSQPTLAEDLIRFLRRCNCRVDQVDDGFVEVLPGRLDDVNTVLRLTRAGLCYSCGRPVERALAEVGSPRCHDCRDAKADSTPLVRRGAKLEIEAYLRVWNALHPAATTTIVDDTLVETAN